MASEIKVDTISEKTSAGGVTIDSVVHKDSAVYPSSADGGALGSASNEWSDLFLADSSVIKFGADQDTTLTHTDGTGLTLNSTNKLCFNDASQFVQGSSNAILSLGATDEIDLTATAIDINGTADISGTTTLGGTLTVNAGAVFNEASADADFRIESNGNADRFFVNGGDNTVLFGTQTTQAPGGDSYAVQIFGTSLAEAGLTIMRGSADSGFPALVFSKSRNTTPGSNTIVANGDILGRIDFFADDGTNINTPAARILAAVDGTPGENDMPATLKFYTTADGAADVTEHFRIAPDGTLTGTDTSIGSNSDSRIKENIADFTYDLAKFKQLQPRTFDWKNPSQHNGASGNRGFVAQDVQAIDDYWVGEIEIEEGTLDYDLIPVGEKALTSKLGKKDAMYVSVINQLIARIEALEG